VLIQKFIKENLYYPRYFYKYIGNRFFIIIALCLLIGTLDGFGLAMFLPLMQMSDGLSHVDPESLGEMRIIIDGLGMLGLKLNLVVTLTFLCTFFLLKGLITYYGNTYKVGVQQFFVKKIRLNMLHALSHIQFKKYITSDAGRIQNTMSGEVARLSLSLSYYLSAMQNIVMVLVYVVFAVLINAKFAILVSIGGYLTNYIFKNIYKITKTESANLTKESNLYQGLLIQFISNFKYLRATGTVNTLEKKLSWQIGEIEKNNRRLGELSALVSAVREPSMIVVVAASILFETQVMGSGLSSILVSLLFFYRALSSLLGVQTFYNNFLGTSGSMENMKDFQENIERFKEDYGIEKMAHFSGELILENASLVYKDRAVIQQVSLNIRRNDSIAFVGESGSGKTTLLNVLCGLIPLSEGRYVIDGIESTKLDLRSLQQRIGYITQEPVIFNASVYDNISLWAPKTPESLARFWQVAEKASLITFLSELDQKEDTLLGNNGINLSGGQRQRISIARELFKDIDILIMDEATSALDSETEKTIQTSIETLKGKYTIIAVAHRLSTIKSADRIFVMQNGKIIETGNYSELMQFSPAFKRMAVLQEL
jgi:ABC-type multidrug transport system fused ATPase/permease subunit